MSKASEQTRGRRRRRRLEKNHVVGLPQLRFVEDLLVHLRQAYDHPNRQLHFDDLFIGLLLAFYNPIVRSLRGIEDASQMPGINQHLTTPAIRRSTAGDAMAVFDPALLEPLIAHLQQRLSPGQIDATDPDLRAVLNRLHTYDGTYFRTAGDVSWALCERHGSRGRLRGRVRLNLHLCNRTGTPTGVSLAGAGDPGEPVALLDHVSAGQVVVADRGCFSHHTVRQLLDGEVDFVLRLQKTVRCDVQEERPLTDADRQAGVVSDQTVLLGGLKSQCPNTPLRLVTIHPTSSDPPDSPDPPDPPDAPDAPQPLRLLTSLHEPSVAAWMVGHVYRRRWDVELYFRWLKSCAHMNHLISQSRNGMTLQIYVAMIGTLLLAVATGRKPDKYAFSLMSLAAAGQGSMNDVSRILNRRWAERDRAQQRRLEKQRQNKS